MNISVRLVKTAREGVYNKSEANGGDELITYVERLNQVLAEKKAEARYEYRAKYKFSRAPKKLSIFWPG
ncbi:MAG: hypothetical protein LBJ64_06305 [Deltaproteobacteria bacterium]|nr:hypothetical protein [Deltaproteobacteria bacterium]